MGDHPELSVEGNHTGDVAKEEDLNSYVSRELEYLFGQPLGRVLEELARKVKLIEIKVKAPMRKHFMGEEVDGVWIPRFRVKSYKRAELVFQLNNVHEAYELIKAIREENRRLKMEQKSLEFYDTNEGRYVVTAIAVLFDDLYRTFLYINFSPKKKVYFITYLCGKWPAGGVPEFHKEMEKMFMEAGYTKIEDREEICKRVKMYLPDESFIYFQ
ncbi:MAG: hypothetical protein ACTSUQ_13485 [Candidatus Freyarchaeota archaeon]